jgi:hypothetical protein
MENKDILRVSFSINKRVFFVILFLILMFLSSVFTMGYLVRGYEDMQNVINLLGWWKTQRDCFQCDSWTLQSITQALSPYNLSIVPAINLTNLNLTNR